MRVVCLGASPPRLKPSKRLAPGVPGRNLVGMGTRMPFQCCEKGSYHLVTLQLPECHVRDELLSGPSHSTVCLYRCVKSARLGPSFESIVPLQGMHESRVRRSTKEGLNPGVFQARVRENAEAKPADVTSVRVIILSVILLSSFCRTANCSLRSLLLSLSGNWVMPSATCCTANTDWLIRLFRLIYVWSVGCSHGQFGYSILGGRDREVSGSPCKLTDISYQVVCAPCGWCSSWFPPQRYWPQDGQI